MLYRIPWADCELSIQVDRRNVGLKGQQDGYQLTFWLNPIHAVNQDLTGQKYVSLNMLHNMDHYIPMCAYWEYVRRYMMGDIPCYIKINNKPKTISLKYDPNKESYIKFIFMVILTSSFLLLMEPSLVALLGPFKEKWPEDVHKWTGERCDWH